MSAEELKAFYRNVDIKQVEGINFKCKECGASFSVPFETQQLYINTCPNCNAAWADISGYTSVMRNLKYGVEYLRNLKSADVSFTLKESK